MWGYYALPKTHRPSNKNLSVRQEKTPLKLYICKTIIIEERVMNLRGRRGAMGGVGVGRGRK